MSTADILSLISTISFILSGICLIVAVLLWFVFKIPAVIGDLSGRTARKSIAKMHESNGKSSGQGYRSGAENTPRRKSAGAVRHAARSVSASAKSHIAEKQMPETNLLSCDKPVCSDSMQTELLEDLQATDVLVDENETVALNETPDKSVRHSAGKKLTMLDEVVLIHTDDVIE